MQSARRLHPHKPARRAERSPPESGERLKEEGPLSNEPPMENLAHVYQFVLLLSCLKWWWRDRTDVFFAGNISIYYPSVSERTGRKVRKKLFLGPDFFVVFGAKHKKHRNSWVVKNEDGKYPDVIVEILSKKTRHIDRGRKKDIYEKVFKTPEYFLFDPEKLEVVGYRLVRGRYALIRPDAHGRLRSEQLGMWLGMHDEQLRFFQADGELVPLPDESALKEVALRERETDRAEREAARAARLEQKNARLLAKLRDLGVDTDDTLQ